MDDAIKAIAASLGTGGIILCAAWLWLQKYVDKKMDAKIAAQAARMKGDVDTLMAFRKQRLEKTIELVPKLQQVASECRHALRLIKSQTGTPPVQEFFEKRESFVDILYGIQLLLQPDSYEAVHGFKAAIDKCYLAFRTPTSGIVTLPKNIAKLISEVDDRYLVATTKLRTEFERIESQLGGHAS